LKQKTPLHYQCNGAKCFGGIINPHTTIVFYG